MPLHYLKLQSDKHFIPFIFLALIILAELLLVSVSLDARVLLEQQQIGALGWLLGYSGDFAKLLVIFVVAIGITLGIRLHAYAIEIAGMSHPARLTLLVLQATCYGIFLYLSFALFGRLSVPTSGALVFWLVSGLITGVLWLWALAPAGFWFRFVREENTCLMVALAISIFVWSLAQFTSELWGPLSEATFHVSAFLLEFQGADLTINPEERILGSGDFVVNIAAACSGYEGMGLMLAFTGVYLYAYRHDFRFPHALLLFPVGMICIWLLNSVRIVMLIIIGSVWSPDIAVGGFHSQAGWITFIACALGILGLAHGSRFFSRVSQTSSADEKNYHSESRMNLPIATLMPLVVLLAVTLLTMAFSSGFAWLYPLRVVMTALAIGYCWRFYGIGSYRPGVEPFAAGAVVAVIWFLLVSPSPETDRLHSETLATAPSVLSVLWVVFRFTGAVITVPIAEELAFRAYILCRASSVDVATKGRLPLSVVGLTVSSVGFGLLHGSWLAGTLAGLIYGILRLRSDTIADAVVAHAVTNGLLFLVTMFTGYWYLL